MCVLDQTTAGGVGRGPAMCASVCVCVCVELESECLPYAAGALSELQRGWSVFQEAGKQKFRKPGNNSPDPLGSQ